MHTGLLLHTTLVEEAGQANGQQSCEQAIVVPLYYAYITFVLYMVLCSYFINHSIIRLYLSKHIYPHRLIPYTFPKVI